jgi:hypothetical protein
MHYKSVIDKYKTQPQFLVHISPEKFVVEHNTKNHKKYKQNKIICWVSFNLHKDLENHYRTLLLLFKPFHETKKNLKKNSVSWNDAYINSKNPQKTLYIISIKMVIIIMNGMICNHNF